MKLLAAITILLLLTFSCQSKKHITSSSYEKKESKESISQTSLLTSTDTRQTLDAISLESLDRGSILMFDGPGQITIMPSGEITATGSNPTLHTFDKSTRSIQQTETSYTTRHDSIATFTNDRTEIQEAKKEKEKDIQRQFKLPWYIHLILAAAILLFLYNLIPTTNTHKIP
jgi:hypothetical protein